MSTLTRLAMRNTSRRRARTLLTTGMVVFGVALLLVALTWMRGAFGSMLALAADLNGHVRVVDQDFAKREELQPIYENLPDVRPLIALLSAQPGVAAVEPRIVTGVTVTVGEEIGEVFAQAVGASERYFRERMRVKDKLAEGAWFSGAPDEIVAGAKVVERTGAKIGDEMLLLGATQDGSLSPVKGKLIGVVRAGGLLDRQVFLPLERLQYLTDMEHGATELLVFAPDHEQADVLAARLGALAELKGDEVQSFSTRDPWRSMAGTQRGVQSAMIAVVVFLTALGIWNTTMMSVLERTHEIGVLRAMGLSKLGTIGLFVMEALVIGAAGGVLGVLAGAYPAWLLESVGLTIGEKTAANMTVMVPETIRGDLTLGTIAIAFALGLVTTLLGSLVPAIRAANIQPVSAMRSGR